MAELDFEHFDSARTGTRSAQVTGILNIAGGACSIALVVGMGLWGYKLAVRDVNGVPVIRAMTGPMRVMPQTPGGDVASFQGLSVNAVAAVGTAAAMPQQVLLAPSSVDLAAEDAAGLGAMPGAEAAVDPTPEIPTSAILPDLGVEAEVGLGSTVLDPGLLEPALPTADVGPSDTDAAIALALADALAEGAVPFTDPLVDLTNASPTPTSSLRPKARPLAGATPEAAAEAPPAAPAASPAEIDPATLEVGTRLVQLGAFDDAAGARAEWARLQAQFGDLLGGKALVIQAAQSGGQTFYRLRAHGFEGEAEAQSLCATLVAQNTPCIPTLHR